MTFAGEKKCVPTCVEIKFYGAFGFIGNRMLEPYGRECLALLRHRDVGVADVDAALRDFGMAMGVSSESQPSAPRRASSRGGGVRPRPRRDDATFSSAQASSRCPIWRETTSATPSGRRWASRTRRRATPRWSTRRTWQMHLLKPED